MIGETTVTIASVTTTTDELGNSTTTQTLEEVSGVMFEPMQSTERTDSRTPGVTTPAKFYLPVPRQLDADDTITDADGVVWNVVGGSSVWIDQTEVPASRASEF